MHSTDANLRPGASALMRDLLAKARSWRGDRSDRASAQRSAGWAFLLRVTNAGIAFLSQVLLARWMGGFEYGVYVYVWTWVLLLGGISSFGLASAPQRFVAEYTEKGDLDGLRGFLIGSRVQGVGTATAIAGAGILGLMLWGDHLQSYQVIPLYLACVCLPLFALTDIQDGIARSYNWIDVALAPAYLIRPVLLLLLMAGAHMAGLVADAVAAMVASIVATWVTAVVQLVVLNRRLRKRVPRGNRRFTPKTWAALAFPIFLVEGFYLLLGYSDVLVLSQFVSPDLVGIYWAALKVVSLASFVAFSVSAAVAHRFTEYAVSGNHGGLVDIVRDSVRWTFWPTLGAVALLLALGYPILWLFGPSFTAGYPLLFLLAIGILVRASIGPVERLLNMLGEQKLCASVYAATFVLNLGLTVLLVPVYGLAGAAASTSIAVTFESILLFAVTKWRLGLHVFVLGGDREREIARVRLRQR